MNNLLDSAKKVLQTLLKANYEAYFVGGMVRDSLLGIEYNDIDITTNALPDDIMKLFPDYYCKGEKYQSVIVRVDGCEFEVTTFRFDIEYTDFRHPKTSIAKSLKEDVIRRDFTINALAMDINGQIYDYVSGKEDLQRRIIRTVNNPLDRFTEDALRMLRACYFAAKLGFVIDDNTFKAMILKADLITRISSERVLAEIAKILQTSNPLIGLELLERSHLADYVPSLADGVKICLEKHIITKDIALFLALCSYNKQTVSDYFHIPNYLRNKVNQAIILAASTTNGDYNRLLLYSYGLEVALLANAINVSLGLHSDLTNFITNEYNDLPIKKTCDLVFKGQDIMVLTEKKPGYWLNDIVDAIKYQVIMGELANDYESIKQFVISNFNLV